MNILQEMSEPNLTPNNRKDLLYVKMGERYYGYKLDFIAQNLTNMEMEFLGCKMCFGIMREATIVNGETTCRVCSSDPNQINTVKTIQNSVSNLEIKCPLLSSCEWKGQLFEADKHLMACASFLVECPKCRVVIPRGDVHFHQSNSCVMREIKCGYCGANGFVIQLEEHFKFCLETKIPCPNLCGVTFVRKLSEQHRSVCQLEKINCPFAKYGCDTKPMLVEELELHKRENIVSHTDMTLSQIEQQGKEISDLRNQLAEKEWELKTLKHLDGVEWEIQNVNELKVDQVIEGPTFYVNNFRLQIFVRNFPDLFLYSIIRIKGEHDKYLQDASITHYKLIIVDRTDFSQSFCQEGCMDYRLRSWKESEMFYYFKVYSNLTQDKDSILVRLYFDVNTQKPLEKLKASKNKVESVRTLSTVSGDPFKH